MIGRKSRVLPILYLTLPAEVSSRCALVRLYDYRDKYLVVDLRRDRARELPRLCSIRLGSSSYGMEWHITSST